MSFLFFLCNFAFLLVSLVFIGFYAFFIVCVFVLFFFWGVEKNTYLNLSDRVIDIPLIGKYFTEVFEYYHQDYITWQRFQSLTKREKKIIQLLVDGLTTSQVATCLFISIETVKTHKKNIYKKLNIKSMVALVKIALILELE